MSESFRPSDDASDGASEWPSAALDAVARLRAIAAVRPHLAYGERVVDAPFERVWSIFGDLERGVPRFDRWVRWIRILERDGESLRLESSSPIPGIAMRYEAIYRPGWCVMRSRIGEVGMAADPLGPDRTRIAHFEGSPLFGALGRALFARTLPSELERVARMCAEERRERDAD